MGKGKALETVCKGSQEHQGTVNECQGRERQVECLHKRVLRLILYGINYNYGNRQAG